jgi:hypothetical protein
VDEGIRLVLVGRQNGPRISVACKFIFGRKATGAFSDSVTLPEKSVSMSGISPEGLASCCKNPSPSS